MTLLMYKFFLFFLKQFLVSGVHGVSVQQVRLCGRLLQYPRVRPRLTGTHINQEISYPDTGFDNARILSWSANTRLRIHNNYEIYSHRHFFITYLQN